MMGAISNIISYNYILVKSITLYYIFMNLSLLYLLPVFLLFSFLFFYFTGKIAFLQTADEKKQSLRKSKVSLTSDVLEFSDYSSKFCSGQLYLQDKQFNLAIEDFKIALESWDPNDKLGLACLYNTLGVTYFNMKEYYFASYYYFQALEVYPNYSRALVNLAFLFETTDKKHKSCLLYKKIWELDKTNEMARTKFYAYSSTLLNYLDKPSRNG
jgi:tetratricopeptide (TPR) repeat protein